MTQSTDISFLKQALDLAKIRRGYTAPNPSVGSIIVSSTNQIIATGYHLGSGHPHAEVEALKHCNANTDLHTIYVTLEPCCHVGKTPPCTDAIIKSGIKRVVYAYCDPNPVVNGRGRDLLIAAGIQCDYVSVPEINDFYERYAYWHRTKLPFVTAKIAMTLDGKTAGPHGEPIAITGQALSVLTHSCRHSNDAILSTVKTIINDDPQFNVRIQNDVIAKPLYLLDTTLRLPQTARIFNTAKSITVFHSHDADQSARTRLTDQGVRCIAVGRNPHGLDLQHVLTQIGHDGMHDLWVEAGGQCFSAFVENQLLQRAYLYIAPTWLGQGQPAFADHVDLMQNASKIAWQQKGNDVFCEIRW